MQARQLLITFLAISAGTHGMGRDLAWAQAPATTVEELPSRLTAGDRVIVTGTQQEIIKGTLQDLSSSSLRVLVEGHPHDVALQNVWRVERRSRDSLLNGVLIGAAVGATLFLKYYSENALCQGGCQFESGALAMVGIGAAAGAGVDALMTRREVVFKRRDRQLEVKFLTTGR
jgi:hypothetical protein